MRKSMMGALAAAAAMTAGAALAVDAPPKAPRAKPTGPRVHWGPARQPNGLTIRSLRRAINSGWVPNVTVKPERAELYLNSHARAMAALLRVLAQR